MPTGWMNVNPRQSSTRQKKNRTDKNETEELHKTVKLVMNRSTRKSREKKATVAPS